MFLKIFTFSLLISLGLAGELDVVELTDNDFSTKIAEHDTVLVMFYAPW